MTWVGPRSHHISQSPHDATTVPNNAFLCAFFGR